jgi:peptidoglycan hydrolase-like protein with peptidoglycan-binding domain
MSQNATPDQTVLEPVDPSTPSMSSSSEPSVDHSTASGASLFASSGSFSVDAYADRLMDELFDDLEQSLDRGAKLSEETEQPDYVALEALSIPQITLSPVLVPRSSMEDEPDLATLEAEEGLVKATPETRWGFGKSFDKLLLALGGVSVLVTALLWFTLHNRWQQSTVANAPIKNASTGTVSPSADQEFLQYMQRSLDVIDRKAAMEQQFAQGISPSPASSNPPALPTLPTVPVPGTPPQSTVAAMPPIERVYIPVYQPPQGTTPAPTLQPSAVPNTPAAPASGATAVAPTRAIPNIAPGATPYTLVGVFESSDPTRSAALFEGNGTTQRIYVGEAIGGSGWTLVSVENNEAIVRRNGEVRSIYAGQQF